MSSLAAKDESKTKQQFNRRQVVILLGIIVINLCLYGTMFVMSRGGKSTPRATTTVETGEPLELREFYKEAVALALGWQADAQLVSATTSWQLASGDRLTLQRPAWSFSFYSPSTNQVMVVTADQRGAQAGRQYSVSAAPQQVVSDWQLGSDDLLLTFLSYGGQDFLSTHPSANIHLQLKQDDEGRSVWYVTAVDPVARQSLIVGVDALSRQVVPSES